MANLYPYFDAGTFESYAAPYNTQPDPNPSTSGIAYGRTTDDKYAGLASLGLYNRTVGAPPTTGVSVEFPFRRILTPFVNYPIVLVPGKKYRFTCRVKTSAINPIASNGMLIGLCSPQITNANTGSQIGTTPDGGRILKFNARGATNNGTPEFTCKIISVADLVANPWAELYVEWTEPLPGTPGGAQASGSRFAVTLNINFLNKNPAFVGQVAGQTYLLNGRMWVDAGFLDEVSLCDLAFGSPAYTKTDETGVGLNDGTVTLNATSTYTRQYSKDNIVFQLSNVFTNIPVGTTTFYVKDTNPAGCAISIPVTILSFEPAPDPPEPTPGTLEIDSKPVNENNFVPWFPGVGKITYTDVLVGNCWDVPAAYRLRTNGKNNMKHALIAVNGEELAFYINFNTPINDPDFSAYRISLVDDNGLVLDNVGTLYRDLFSDGVTYNIYGSVTLNGIRIDRYYKLVIYNTTTDDILYVSGLIEVLSQDDAKCLSVRLRYRASVNIKGFRYESLPDYYNIHRLRFYRIDEQTEANVTQYRAISSGQLRNIRFDMDRYIGLEGYYFDDIAHRAAEIWQAHDLNIINDKSYLLKTPYKRLFDKDKRLTKGVVEMYDQAFSTSDRFSRLGNINIIINSDFLLQEGGRIKL